MEEVNTKCLYLKKKLITPIMVGNVYTPKGIVLIKMKLSPLKSNQSESLNSIMTIIQHF